ncbi:carbohydrate ABC transporter permease [Alkaliphilus peptidifermentans]|uniref:Raffinose/stachyose/melibiose transport system permease protein n=1 Tax=Alkaliphilus peptidifermentans DSM 18978 TaxID=1120976 RepID=A0A1G5HR86_9FIRM|nr:sugar ABC transporter permease [Alkaliphilus peptidifermentans]SCY66263.1 raffinose/stachyose/melibiose transport system permease protein [Alkaliphilus peptidifermentans DSM 18978]
MKKVTKTMEPYLFMLPCFLMLFIFIFLPLIQNFINSFYDFNAFSPTRTFVGFDNFRILLRDKVIVTALTNNIRYAIISVIFQVFVGLILAAILEDNIFRKVAPFFRVVYFMPVVISISVICLLFSFIYHPQIGLLNNFLKLIGLGSLAKPWLGLSSSAPYAVIAVSQWQSIGYIMILFIVAMQKIPKELYEAAEIDGASKLRQFFSVTIPQVREMIFVTTLITITGSMLVFNEPYILTKGGGPGTSSITMAVHMYQSGFFRDRMGYASALAIIIFAITAILAVIQLQLFKSGKED